MEDKDEIFLFDHDTKTVMVKTIADMRSTTFTQGTPIKEYIQKQKDLAFHQGQIEQLKEDIQTVTRAQSPFTTKEDIFDALQTKLKSYESKH